MRMLKLAAVCGLVVPYALCGGGASAQTAPDPVELQYVPIEPCRAFDTRATAAINANQVRSFHISGSTAFPPQGGPAHGCGVPTYATAVSLTLTAVNETADGYLTAFPYNSTRPSNVSLYYHANFTLTNTITTPINQQNISVYASRSTHVAGDVIGYYVPPMAGVLNPDGSIYKNSGRIVSASSPRLGLYYVTFDRDIRSCSATATAWNTILIASVDTLGSPDQNTVAVNLNATSGDRSAAYVYISVHC